MTDRTSAQAFADAVSGMVHAVPVGDVLHRLVKDCVEVVGAEAVAILVLDAHRQLSLLTSSSASASQLELLQAQDAQGPCVDVIESGKTQSASSTPEMTRRWGHVGEAIAQAGFASVSAHPLVWHGRVLGGLNVFRGDAPVDQAEMHAVCQAFADVATIVLVHSAEIPADELTTRVHRATSARHLVEQAKGVLSELHDVDLEGAATRLEELAAARGLTHSETAQRIIDDALVDRHRGDGSSA